MSASVPTTSVRGRFLWDELLTTDVERAKDFYTKVIGWGTMPAPGGVPYTLWTVGETPVGGVMTLPEQARASGTPPHWISYVGTPDVDATTNRARELGATVIVEPTDIPDVGRFSVLADPQGAFIAAFTPGSEPPPEVNAGVGHVSWHELSTTDYEAALRFYQDLFGWEPTTSQDMGPMGIYQMFGRGGRTYGGMFNKTPDMPGPPSWLLYIRVTNVRDTAPRVPDLGGQVLNGPMEVPGGDLIAQCLDPMGAAFGIHSKAI